MFTEKHNEVIRATADLIGRTGATQFEIGWEHDDVPVELMGWYCKATYQGTEIRAEGAGPIEAADALARKVLDGGLCMYCKRRITIDNVEDLEKCFRARVGDTWMRGCEIDHEQSGDKIPTARKLAHALFLAGAPGNMIEAALNGYFDEYNSHLDFPLVQLVSDCEKIAEKTGNKSLSDLADRVRNGDFDATKEEADIYFQSDEGKALIDDFSDEIQKNAQETILGINKMSRAERRRMERKQKKGKI